jgi:hypothetical protein
MWNTAAVSGGWPRDGTGFDTGRSYYRYGYKQEICIRPRARIAPAGSVAGKQKLESTTVTTSAPARRCQCGCGRAHVGGLRNCRTNQGRGDKWRCRALVRLIPLRTGNRFTLRKLSRDLGSGSSAWTRTRNPPVNSHLLQVCLGPPRRLGPFLLGDSRAGGNPCPPETAHDCPQFVPDLIERSGCHGFRPS